MPFLFLSLDHVVTAYQVGLGHVRVDFRGVDVTVTEHALHNLDGDATAEADGCRKSMPGAVRCQVLSQLHLLAEDRQLAVVADVRTMRQLEVVLFEDVEDDGQQDDGVALVGLLSVVVNQPVSLNLLSLCEIHVEQVDVCEAGVTTNEETIFHFASLLALRLIGNETVELFAGKEYALLAAALHDVQTVVGVGGDDLADDGLADDGLDGVMDFCNGCVGHQVRAVGLAPAKVLIEAAELLRCEVFEMFEVGSLVAEEVQR